MTDTGSRPGTGAPAACLAIDIGGTKLGAGLVDEHAHVLVSERIRTPRATDPDALFRVVADLVEICAIEAAAIDRTIVACGVGSGGPMAAGGDRVSPLNIPSWRDFPLRERLEKLPWLAGVPVAIDNDAKALALGERWDGSGRGVDDFIAMVVSTGIGGGIVLNGRLLDGAAGNAGHIGHITVIPDGRRCACGAFGCLEAEASGTSIEEVTGRPAEAADRDVIDRTGVLVGRAVASVANLLDLRLALVGGSVALGFGLPFFAAAQREIDARACIGHARGTRIEPVGLGAEGPLVGAAALGWRRIDRLETVERNRW